MEEIEISRSDDDALFIRQKLNNYNNIFVQPDNHERLCLVVRRDDFIVGGLVGGTYWNWLYIELFWVDENERNNGLGTRILAKAEELAIQRGCRNAHLETHDFQSLGFYKRRAYVVFGELEDLPEGHTKFYMHKQLIKKKSISCSMPVPADPSTSSRQATVALPIPRMPLITMVIGCLIFSLVAI